MTKQHKSKQKKKKRDEGTFFLHLSSPSFLKI